MKRNFNILLLAIFIAIASCSFTTKTFENPNKDKLLMQLISYLLEQGHFQPKVFNDEFSLEVYERFLNRIDPYKHYFYKSDIEVFKQYEQQLDDQIQNYEIEFFNIVYEKLTQRINESVDVYNDILSKPFDYEINENFNSESEELDYVSSRNEMYERWRKQLKFTTLSSYHDLLSDQQSKSNNSDLTTKTKEQIEEESRLSTLGNLEQTSIYFNDLRRDDWLSIYINSIAESFDPHTYYFAPQDKDRFDASMSGKYEGIGARLEKKMNEIRITELISGGSAWRQNKLQVGDIILKVRQEDENEAVSVLGKRLDDAVKLIKGPKGTSVILTLRRVDGTIEDLKIPRDEIELEETYVKSSILKSDGYIFGVINLPKFYIDFEDLNSRNATTDLKKEIQRLKSEGMNGLVLDLRNNGGGSLKTVVDIGGLFIDKGPIVQVRSTGYDSEVLRDRDPSIIWDGALVILVNEFSASASEILAAAMQDYKRAVIIGSKQTYGKGTVQNIIDLNKMIKNNTNGDMGALKFTTQKYYRINGGSTQLEGVKSDIVLPNRYTYMDMGEKDQDNPLPWDEIQPATYKEWENSINYEEIIKLSRNRVNNNPTLKLIDESARWIEKNRSKKVFSLNYKTFKNEMIDNERESKKFDSISNYKTDLLFSSLSYEFPLMDRDSVLRDNRNRWHESLSKDIYMEEALNVLKDLLTRQNDLSLLRE
ncbi:MAG: carboxy terminal-processing peptidase [Flavobacteriaceae bacterium]